MTNSTALEQALFKNRQKQAFEKLRPTLPLKDDLALADYSTSRLLDQNVRSHLATRRPTGDGQLLETSDLGSLEEAVREYFSANSGTRYYLFILRAPEIGALSVSADQASQHAVELLLLDGDAVYGCSEDTRDVVSLDRTEKDDGTVVFEFFRFRVPVSGD